MHYSQGIHFNLAETICSANWHVKFLSFIVGEGEAVAARYGNRTYDTESSVGLYGNIEL